MNMKDAMHFYANLGLPVIPLCSHDHRGMSGLHGAKCTRPGKRPLVKNWQTRGVPTSGEIEKWFTQWPSLNIGLVFGSPSGLVGIDVDGDGGHNLLQEMSGGVLPDTLAFSTPNNGMRYLYRIPNNQVLMKAGVTDSSQPHTECSLLGEGCQTVLPPSIHPNGGRYQWITGPTITN